MSRLSTICLVSASILLSGPAFALSMGPLAGPSSDGVVVRVVCAEGSAHCLKLDAEHIKVGKQIKSELLNNPGGDQKCKGGGICGEEAAGGADSGPAIKKSGTNTKGNVAHLGSTQDAK